MRILIALLLTLASAAQACGPDTNCPIGDRHYRIALPDGHDGTTPIGALIWSHGYRGSAAGVMRNGSLRRMAAEMNLALIAAQGVDGSWDLPNGPGTFDSDGLAELTYFDAVIADATTRFPIDPGHIFAAGFSAGGMMTWHLACQRPKTFAGFAPIAGTFWLKPPETCAAQANLIHIHGTSDKTVPLTGRAIRETKQGDVAEVLAFYSTFGNFTKTGNTAPGSLTCENKANPQGQILEFCLFDGGHSFRTEHLRHALGRLIAAQTR